jgi:hypothetical protein
VVIIRLSSKVEFNVLTNEFSSLMNITNLLTASKFIQLRINIMSEIILMPAFVVAANVVALVSIVAYAVYHKLVDIVFQINNFRLQT